MPPLPPSSQSISGRRKEHRLDALAFLVEDAAAAWGFQVLVLAFYRGTLLDPILPVRNCTATALFGFWVDSHVAYGSFLGWFLCEIEAVSSLQAVLPRWFPHSCCQA